MAPKASKAPKAKQPAPSVQTTLTEGTTAAQANILLDLIEYIAEGKPVQSVVSDVCKVRTRCARVGAQVSLLLGLPLGIDLPAGCLCSAHAGRD